MGSGLVHMLNTNVRCVLRIDCDGKRTRTKSIILKSLALTAQASYKLFLEKKVIYYFTEKQEQ